MASWIGHGLDFFVSFAVVTLLFAMIFKFLPDVKVPWRKVWIGAIGTTFLFTVGKLLLGLYLGRSSTTSAYGAAGSVIVILMWIYYASVILFFGAEFTQVYAKRTGAVIRPSHYAVPVTADERAQQGMVSPSLLEEAPPNGAGPMKSWQPVASAAPGKTMALRTSPAEVIHRNALGVVSLMLATGFVAGAFFQLRQGIKIYRKVRKAAEAVA